MNTFIQTDIPIVFLKLRGTEENIKAASLMPTLVFYSLMNNHPIFVCGHLLIALDSSGS